MTEYNMAGARYRSAYLRDGSKTKRATAATLDEAGETVLASAKAAIAKYDPDGTALKFAFISDLHRSENSEYAGNSGIDDRYSLRLLSRLCDDVDLDAVFCGGDIVNGRDENASYVQKNMNDVVDDFDDLIPYTNVFFTCGNHDKRYSTQRTLNTNEFLHGLWDRMQYDGNGVELHYIDETNFYVDFTKHKVRMIFVNQYDGVDSNSGWYANEFATDANGLTTHGSTVWHSALPTTGKADWLVGVVYHGADTGTAGSASVSGFKYSDLSTTLQSYVDGGGRGVICAISGHYHATSTKLLDGLNLIHVNCAYSTEAQAGTSSAYCLCVIVLDTTTGIFHEIRIGRGSKVNPHMALIQNQPINGVLENGCGGQDGGGGSNGAYFTVNNGNKVHMLQARNYTNLTNLKLNTGSAYTNTISSDTERVLFSAKAGDVIKTEIIFSESNDSPVKETVVFSPQIPNVQASGRTQSAMAWGQCTPGATISHEVTLAEDKDFTAIGVLYKGDSVTSRRQLDFELNIYKNGVELTRSV